MKRKESVKTTLSLGLMFFVAVVTTAPPANAQEFTQIFSIPREPQTSFSPGQGRGLEVPPGRKVVITDIYIRNLGGGLSSLLILEQRSPTIAEVRYSFLTDDGEVTIINFTTGLKLGDEGPIQAIAIENSINSEASILTRVNGRFVAGDGTPSP